MTLLEELALRVTLYHGMALGALLIAVVFAFPGGAAGLLGRLRRLRQGRPREETLGQGGP